MISPSQRPLPDNTQHSQQTNFHAPGGIRTHDRSRRAAVDLRLRPRGYWDRHVEDDYWNKLREKSAFCWSLLRKYITMHGMQNVKFITPTCEESCLAPLEKKVSAVCCIEFQRSFIKLLTSFRIINKWQVAGRYGGSCFSCITCNEWNECMDVADPLEIRPFIFVKLSS